MSPKVLIVEDEILIADSIRRYLADSTLLPALTFVGPAASVERAVELADRHEPALALVDIRLRRGGSGIEFGRWLRRAHVRTAIIFLTSQAGDAYVAAAQELHPNGYLVKPIQPRSLCAMASVALFSAASAQTPILELSIGGRRERFRVSDLLYVEQDHVYAVYHFTGAEPVIVRATLTDVERELAPLGRFVRTHRSAIVNAAYVTAYDATAVYLGDVSVRMARARLPDLQAALRGE